MKILIIDDSYEVRDVLRLIIERHNLEVVEAVDGQDGLEKAKTHHPDLIIVDALMPRVDGFTFLRNIKKDPRLHSIPCVLFSAIYTGGKDRELALSLGAATFIAKPSNSEEFLKEIESILERKMQPVAHIEKKMIEDEKEFLKSYNQIVVAKLEEKVKELEEVIAKKKRSETIFKGLFESNPDAIVVVNHDGRIVSVNKTLEMLFGYNRDELIDNTIEVLVPECFRKQHIEFRNGYLSQPSVRAMGKCFGLFARRKDGNEFYADIMLSPVTTSEGLLVVGVIRDITERKRMEGEIKRLFAAIDQSVNVVFITDAKGNIEYVNSMFEQVAGYPKEEVIGRNPRMLASGETTHAEYAELWETIAAGKTWRGVFKNKKKNGQSYWGNGLISPIKDENGKVTHFLAIQEDITEKMQSEERIKYLAAYDELTGVFNRTHFVKQLNEWISYAETNKQTGILLLINLDKFKLINDTYGHSVGDSLLRNIAETLKEAITEIHSAHKDKTVEEGIIIGRMGGDEFAILLPSRDEKEGTSVAEYIREKIETFRFAEITGSLTASIGVVSYPRQGITAKDLFINADAAIYLAKELGYNRTQLYREGDFVLEKMRSRIAWRDHIQKALAEDRFEPWFQPILCLRDNKVHHYEALARMRDIDGVIILPGSFIDVAEDMGLVTDIDRVIIEKTLMVQVSLNKKGISPSFSVNLSGKELGDEWLLAFLRSRITATGADPRCLIFEITETAAIRELDKAIKFIRELRSLGCSFSLDDFGVGFTSFRYLKEMEVDYIKIDGSFIRKLHENKTDRLFVKAIADVAEGMGIKTIAEFVENEEVIRILREYGVDYAQGYFIGKPSPDIAGLRTALT
ncbi:MAG: EAL domain-containing protein [Planctomycetes bacterium]|nr:EAL domain-containing protein [Planctomycetota bacterium]